MLERAAWETQAEAAAAKGSKTFSLAARSFPPRLRKAAHSIYWFCRHTDDMVDEASDPSVARVNLDAWEKELASNRPESPILRLFQQVREENGIPVALAHELIAGVRMDLDQSRYENFPDLRQYCFRVASVVGLMMTHAIGYRDPAALDYAEEMGVAMQLTNILRDVGEDLTRGRVYIPRQELREFGFHNDFPGPLHDERFQQLMRFQIARARASYQKARLGIGMLEPRGRLAVDLAARYYGRILDRIEKNGHDVLTRRAVVPKWEKYSILIQTLVRQ